MTEHPVKPADHVYYGIRSLKGWDEALDRARDWGGIQARIVGRLLSAVLVAGGEDRIPVAITGELDDEGTGSLAVLHSDVVVIVKAISLKASDGTSDVSVHSLSNVTFAGVTTQHIYYDGIDSYPRHRGLEVRIKVCGADFTFRSRTYDATELTNDDAAKAALGTLRQHLAG